MATTTSSITPGAINFSGLNGFDFSSIMNSELQIASQPMQALQTRQTDIQTKDSALSTLGTQMTQLEVTVRSLASQTSFTSTAATSADTTTAAVSAGSGALAGTYDLNISNLAKSQVTASTTGYTNTTDIVADGGSISFTIGGQTTTPIQITGQTSLASLASQINSQNSGVFAAVVNDGTNNKLVVTSRQTGQANGFTINNSLTISSGTVLAFAGGQSATSGNAQDAVDASFSVNGVNITSASNTVTTAVPGVTISLVQSGETTISVTPDYSTLQDTLKTLVSQYNSLQQFVSSQTAVSNGQPGPLGNDPVTRQIMKDIRNQLLGSSGGGQYQYLSQVGVQFNADGTLAFDQNAFQTAMNSPTAVQSLFQGTGSNGLFNQFLSSLYADDATAGLISTTSTSNQAAIQSLGSDIAAQQQLLDMRRAQLTKYFAAADQAMIALRASSQSLTQLGTQSLF